MSYTPVKSAADFQKVVVPGETRESRHLEFKGAYKWHGADRHEEAIECCRDIAQLANTEGGVLLIGVSQKMTADGRIVAHEILGCPEVDGLAAWVEDAIRNHLDPPAFAHSLDVIGLGAQVVLAVNVEQSGRLLAVSRKDGVGGIEYFRRNDLGKVRMTPGEVEQQITLRSGGVAIRLRKVFDKTPRDQPVDLVPVPHLLLAAPEAARAQLAGRPTVIPLHSAGCRPIWTRMTDDQISLTIFFANLPAPCVELATGQVRSACVTADGRAALELTVRIVLHPKDHPSAYHLEPA